MGTLDGAAREGLTVVRTIVSLSFVPPTAVSDGQVDIFAGIGVVSQEGFVSSVVPDADIQGDRPPRGWLYRDMRIVIGAASMVTVVAQRMAADVRGSRKVDNGELILVLDAVNVDGTTFGVLTEGIIRCVFLYP